MVFESFISTTTGTVVFEFYLPFLLIFSLFFGLMDRVKPFGEHQRRLHVLISLIASLYIILFSPFAAGISGFFATLFGETSLIIVTLLIGMMIVALLTGMGATKETWDKVWKRAFSGIVLLAFIIAAAIFVTSGGLDLLGAIGGTWLAISGEDMLIIGLIIITILAMWFMGRGPED